MEILLFFFLFAGVIAIVVNQSKRTRENWARAGQDLGLSFRAGGIFGRPVLEGEIRGITIHVSTFTRGSGKSSSTYTRYRAQYPNPLGLRLRLTREGFFSGLAKAFGSQDIQVGDAAFDREVVVKGSDPAEIARFLGPARRSRVAHLLGAHSGAVIDEKGITWERRGTERKAAELASAVRLFVRVALSLCGDREEDRGLGEALVAQGEGRIEEALAILGRRTGLRRESARKRRERATLRPRKVAPQAPPPPTEPPVEEPGLEAVEERLLEAELLHLGGRDDEAREILEEELAEAPRDSELKAFAEHLDAAASTAAEVAQDEAPTAALDAPTACAELFGTQGSSLATERLFRERYCGKRIEWSGTMTSAEACSYDFILGQGEFTKATFIVHEIPRRYGGADEVRLIVRLPAEAFGALDGHRGERFALRATLLKVDAFVRNLYASDGELLGPATSG